MIIKLGTVRSENARSEQHAVNGQRVDRHIRPRGFDAIDVQQSQHEAFATAADLIRNAEE